MGHLQRRRQPSHYIDLSSKTLGSPEILAASSFLTSQTITAGSTVSTEPGVMGVYSLALMKTAYREAQCIVTVL